MRDYAKVSPMFWTRGSGKRLRGDPEAQVLALYLVTCPAANMVGIYYTPFVSIAHETGLGAERATEALKRLAKVGFAFYDHDHDLAWIPNMASYQLGDELKEGDKRRGGAIRAELEKVGGHRFVAEFWRKYGVAYGLGPAPIAKTETIEESGVLNTPAIQTIEESGVLSTSTDDAPDSVEPEGASCGETLSHKGLTAQSTREEQEKSRRRAGEVPAQETLTGVSAPPTRSGLTGSTSQVGVAAETKTKSQRGTRIDPEWRPTADAIARLRAKHHVDPIGSLDRFRNHFVSKSGRDAVKLDWERTFANWVDEDVSRGKLPKLAVEDRLPILRLPNREALLAQDRQAALPVDGFSFGATK